MPSLRPAYEYGRWRSVYEYDRRLTKSSIEAAGTPATGLLLHMGQNSNDLLHMGLAGNDLLLHMGLTFVLLLHMGLATAFSYT